MSLAAINTLDTIAYLAGLFEWPVADGSYTNPDGSTVSFHVINNFGIPIAQYIAGEVNTFNLINGALGNPAGITDPNKALFNTQSTATNLNETIQRKYTVNRIPFANYDQPVDLGVGGQEMEFTVVMSGTMYQTAMQNIVQCLFNNSKPGLGTLQHPFYTAIKKVLPISLKTSYIAKNMNFVLVTITFITSDLSHLNPSALKNSLSSEISTWFIGLSNAILSIGGTISAIKTLPNQISGGA